MDFTNIEAILGICVGAGILCAITLFGGGLVFLLNRRRKNFSMPHNRAAPRQVA